MIPLTQQTLDPYGNQRNTPEGRRVAGQKNWVRGWWEHILPEPVFVEDKYHLKKICQDYSKKVGRDVIPKAFAKPRSQGKGYEWSF